MRWTSGDGVTLDVLAPSMPFLADTGDDVNENSIVAMLHYRRFSRTLHGRRRRSSKRISPPRPCHPERSRGARRHDRLRSDLHADVVKVGHHGSRYASTPSFRRRRPPSHRDNLRRPAQHVRPSSAGDDRGVVRYWSPRSTNGSVRSDLPGRWIGDDDAAMHCSLSDRPDRTHLTYYASRTMMFV